MVHRAFKQSPSCKFKQTLPPGARLDSTAKGACVAAESATSCIAQSAREISVSTSATSVCSLCPSDEHVGVIACGNPERNRVHYLENNRYGIIRALAKTLQQDTPFDSPRNRSKFGKVAADPMNLG